MIIYSTPKKLVELRRLYRDTESFKGFTLIEILVVVMLIGVMTALVAPNIRFGIDPLKDTTNRIAGNFKLMRARAMGQTSAYRISQISASQLKVERARKCVHNIEPDPNDPWEREPIFTDEDLSLNEAGYVKGLAQHENGNIQIVEAKVNGTVVTPTTSWTLCFNSRGLANNSLFLTLKNTRNNLTKRIEVFSGGGVQTYEN